MKYIILGAAVFTLAGCTPANPDAELFQKAQDVVRGMLKDPDSAIFSDLYRCGKSGYVKGQVNAKNSFGGYIGKQSFIYFNGVATLSEEDGERYIREMNECTAQIHKMGFGGR